MTLRESILRLLADGKPHSEKELSQFLGIPSNILPQTLAQLLDSSIDLEQVDKKGYRIMGGLELLNKDFIYSELGNVKQYLKGLEILIYVDSTNSYLLKKAGCLQNYAVFAEQQTAGRGQCDRPWISSFGKSICLSFLWTVSKPPYQLKGLSLVVGVAVVRALQEYGLTGIKLKWPNDIVYDEKKLGGILIETRLQSAVSDAIVIGIGLNLYHPSTPLKPIDQAVTDIYSIQGCPPKRNRLAGLILKTLLSLLVEFETKGLLGFISEWQQLDSLINKPIKIGIATDVLEGIARGIDVQGRLCVDIQGDRRCFSSAEIQIKTQR